MLLSNYSSDSQIVGQGPSLCHKNLYDNGSNCFATGLGDWVRGAINIISDITLYLTVSQIRLFSLNRCMSPQIFLISVFLIFNY